VDDDLPVIVLARQVEAVLGERPADAEAAGVGRHRQQAEA